MIPKELEARILRLFHVEKWPVGSIAGQLGVHHSTVRRVLAQAGVPLTALPRRPSKIDPYLPFIEKTLEEWPSLCASRLYAMVRERGYSGGPDHFRATVARVRPRKPAEAFLPLRTLPGEQAQVDWAHFGHVEIAGARRLLVAFVMVLSWSRMVFLRFGLDLRTAAFLDHHVAAFAFFGGIARTLVYDNLKSVVIERVGDAIRFNETLLAFAAHHRFEPRPAAPYRGNEKGRVERTIRFARDSFFAARRWRDLDDLNAQALTWCEGQAADRRFPEDRTRTVRDAFAEERGHLISLPLDRFPTEDRVEARVGKMPYVRFDANDYSVPHDRVRRTLVVLASPERVRVLDGSEIVAEHDRSWGRGQRIEDPRHLAALVDWKRNARKARGMDRLAHAAPNSRDLLVAMAERGGNLGAATSALLRLLDTYGAEELAAAIAEALTADVPHPQAVRQILERRRHARGQPPALEVPLPDDSRVRDLVVRPHDLSTYDQLGAPHDEG